MENFEIGEFVLCELYWSYKQKYLSGLFQGEGNNFVFQGEGKIKLFPCIITAIQIRTYGVYIEVTALDKEFLRRSLVTDFLVSNQYVHKMPNEMKFKYIMER